MEAYEIENWQCNTIHAEAAAVEGLEGAAMEIGIVAPHLIITLKISINLNHWIWHRRGIAVAVAEAGIDGRKIVESSSDQRYPFFRRSIVLCS